MIEGLLWRYIGIVQLMSENPGMYGLDAQRTMVHCELLDKLTKDTSLTMAESNVIIKKVFHNMDWWNYDAPTMLSYIRKQLKEKEIELKESPDE